MATLGISPGTTKPPFLSVRTTSSDGHPKSGILLNGRHEFEPSGTSPISSSPLTPQGLFPATKTHNRRESEPVTPPITPTELVVPADDSPYDASSQPRIRFAPLPDPRRLSQGEVDAEWPVIDEKGHDEPTSVRTYEYQVRGQSPGPPSDRYSEAALDSDRDMAIDDSDGEDRNGSRSRRWSKSMTLGGSWKGTKKLLGMKEDKQMYSEGAPLKKTLSTGTSFRSVAEHERKKTFGGSPLTPTSSRETLSSHRRNSSLEPTSGPGSATGTSPHPVRMLNGRVYGSRRASEAAARERELRERIEPAFVEWGFGKQSGMGSNAAPAKATSRNEDDGDGSGMEWVKRRREEREKQRKLEAEQRTAAAAASSGRSIDFAEPGMSSSLGSQSDHPAPTTPIDAFVAQRPTPIIQVSEHSPVATKFPPLPEVKTPTVSLEGRRSPQHVMQAIPIPQRNRDSEHDDGHGSRGRGSDLDDDGDDEHEKDDDDDDDEEDEDEDEDDDDDLGDFSEDEEDDEEAVR